jgi:Catalase
LGGGNPLAPDNAQDNVRGLAVRFDLGNGANSDLVMISAPVFFVKTPALFVEFLQIVGSGDKDKLNAFFQAHPESTRQNAFLTSHPVPASYAGVDYWGVHAFTFTNAAGDTKVVKYKAIPEAGELGLSPDEVKAKGPDFYSPERKERRARDRSFLISSPFSVRRETRPVIPRSDGTMRTTAPPRRSARSRLTPLLRMRPATPLASYPATWRTALPVPPTTQSSQRGRPPMRFR